MAEDTETGSPGLRTGGGIGLALSLAGAVVVAGAVALVLQETAPDKRAVSLTIHLAGVALPVGFGLWRLSHRRSDRFAWLLLGTGLLWSVATLAESTDSVVYSIGREWVWVVEVAIVGLMLAFPLGTIKGRAERRTLAALIVVAALLYLPTGLLSQFPEPSPWASCGTDCPPNAFALTDGSSALVDDVVRPLRELITAFLFGVVAVLLIRRTRSSGSLLRHALVPVAAVAVYRVLALVSYQVLRAAGVESAATEMIGSLYVLTLPLVTISFAVGLLRQRLFVAQALEQLTLGLKQHANAGALRTGLAEALDDPGLGIVYWLHGDEPCWVDETGWPIAGPEESPGRTVTIVTADGRRLAAITHDSLLDPALVHAASKYALSALENERLIGQLNVSLEELAGSRARIVAVADEERRRIERDLHDGAQQRLVAMRIKLELVAERIEADSPEGAAAIRALESDVEGTIDEVRSFARGIYPPLLSERGLSEALSAAGRTSSVPTVVHAGSLRRFEPEVEATVYFACMEALQNTAKHATGATRAVVTVTQNPHLRFEVRDDGNGFDADGVAYGTGLTNLRDRLEAVGGKLRIESEQGVGTTVSGTIPVG